MELNSLYIETLFNCIQFSQMSSHKHRHFISSFEETNETIQDKLLMDADGFNLST